MRQRVLATILLASLVLGVGYYFDRATSGARPVDDVARAASSTTGGAGKPAHETPVHDPASGKRASRIKTAPLPPPGTPLKDIFANLAIRAQSGDRKASVRLFHDTAKCRYAERLRHRLSVTFPTLLRMTKPANPDTDRTSIDILDTIQTEMDWLKNIEPMCEGVADDVSRSSLDWVRLAAQQGDRDAIDCYLDQDFVQVNDAMQHLQWLADFQQAGPDMAYRAVANGDWKAASLLEQAYDGNGITNWLGQTIAPNPKQAYQYAYLLTLGQTSNAFVAERLNTLGSQLTANEIVAAKAWANEIFIDDFHGTPMSAWELHTICPSPMSWLD
jgi:hypothetical protein